MPKPVPTPTDPKIVVDLSGLKLTSAQIETIGAAVRSTALRALADLPDSPKGKLSSFAFIPIRNRPGWIGLVARDLSQLGVTAGEINQVVTGVRI